MSKKNIKVFSKISSNLLSPRNERNNNGKSPTKIFEYIGASRKVEKLKMNYEKSNMNKISKMYGDHTFT